jgi:hypothetical protein
MNKYNYVITIKEPDYKKVDAITFLMLLLAIAFFSYVALHQWSSKVYHNAAILYIVIAAFIILWSARKRGNIAFYRLALFTAAIGWFTEPVSNYWMAGLYLIAALLERQVKFPQEIGVDDSGITFNTLPAKEYEWKEINNLLLKEGILTVDYKNNKLFQQEIESEVSTELEREFNKYCQAKLASAH